MVALIKFVDLSQTKGKKTMLEKIMFCDKLISLLKYGLRYIISLFEFRKFFFFRAPSFPPELTAVILFTIAQER